MPKESRVSPSEIERVKRLWQASESMTVSEVSDFLKVSRTYAHKIMTKGQWQKNIGVASNAQKQGVPEGAQILQSSHQPSPSAGLGNDPRSSTSPSPAVSVAPDAEATRRADSAAAEAMPNRSVPAYDEIKIPDGLEAWEREDFVKAAIVARQKQVQALQAKELSAVKSKLYHAIKHASTGEGPALALAVERNVKSLRGIHAAEMESEIQKVKLDLDEFAGQPTPAKIVVHMIPGRQIGPKGKRMVEAKNAAEVANLLQHGTRHGADVQDVDARELP